MKHIWPSWESVDFGAAAIMELLAAAGVPVVEQATNAPSSGGSNREHRCHRHYLDARMFSQDQQILVTRHDEVGPGSPTSTVRRIYSDLSRA